MLRLFSKTGARAIRANYFINYKLEKLNMNPLPEHDVKHIIHDALVKYNVTKIAKSFLKNTHRPQQYIDIVINFARLYKDNSVLEQLWAMGLIYG